MLGAAALVLKRAQVPPAAHGQIGQTDTGDPRRRDQLRVAGADGPVGHRIDEQLGQLHRRIRRGWLAQLAPQIGGWSQNPCGPAQIELGVHEDVRRHPGGRRSSG